MTREYKDSGFEWIGKIPKSWEVDIAKHVFRQRRDKGNGECQLLAATQKYGMYPQHLLEGVVKVAADTDLSQFKTVHRNDYVISLRSFQGGFEMSDYEGVCSPAYQVFFATRQINNQYYKYLFKSDAFIQEINSLTVGIREGKNILYDDFALLPIPIPTVCDQQRIADYLDKKCGEIDALIALQEQMIAQLTDYKQSVITEAVTKGLNPDVQFVPSGIDWIGDVPKGWRVMKVKHAANSFAKGNGITKDEVFTNGNTPCVRYGEIYSKYKNSFKSCLSATNIEIQKSPHYFHYGDILCAGTGELVEEIGKSIVYLGNDPCLAGGDIIVISHHQEPTFFNYALNSHYAQAQKSKSKAKLKVVHISAFEIGSVYIALPSLSEQRAIAEHLDIKCCEIDKLIETKQQKIETLKEYKKSVIFEAVTGKTIIE
jgi:type I restriction enzyme S subunit